MKFSGDDKQDSKDKEERNTWALVKRFMTFYRPHKKLFYLDIFTAAMQAVFSILVGVLINTIMKDTPCPT